ncbi:MAG: copper amine oxidase N-terminal domain-containing protein [Oscillospiraceae bacterium]|nr:copper amine oxidase N-terminal domain-containing protein [Oscillospiraceae bacterium]
MKLNLKKTAAAFIASAMLLSSAAFAKENVYTYNKFLVNIEIPQSGICDVLKSYVGHEDEDIISYFSGLISAFTNDIDGDGDAELFTVEDNLIKIYGVSDENVVYLDDVKQDLICTGGESYANVFVKACGMERFLCVEYFNDTGASKSYSLKIYSMDKESKQLSTRAKIEKTIDDESVTESVSGVFEDRVVSYSKSVVNGTEYLVNNDEYADCTEAAEVVLTGSGFADTAFISSANRLDLYNAAEDNDYRISKYLSDVEPQTYIRATGIRNGGVPVVIFDDYSMLPQLSAPVTEVTVTVNGEEISFKDQDPVIIDGRTLVPARGVFEALGAEVEWIGESQKVIVSTEDTMVTLTLDSKEYYVNGDVKYLDVPASLINDRTMVPVRAISESLGCNVEWDGNSNTVIITTAE